METFRPGVEKAETDERVPNLKHFTEIYSVEDINADVRQAQAYRRTPEYHKSVEGSDSEIMERVVADAILSNDWFHEDELYGDDENYEAIIAIPTNPIDDMFNHIDTICVIKNELTGGEQVPFSLDETYTTDLNKIYNKFNWRHMYGKTERANTESEFGSAFTYENEAGYKMQGIKRLNERFKHGLKIPGFASAKYYENTDAIDGFDLSDVKKGRIDVMPRFVIGFQKSLVEELSIEPNRKSPNYPKDMKKYNSALLKARCCVLSELEVQSKDLINYLENLDDSEIAKMDPEELAAARKQAEVMGKYFENAMNKEREMAKNDPVIKEALSYTLGDPVCVLLNGQSENTLGKHQKIAV